MASTRATRRQAAPVAAPDLSPPAGASSRLFSEDESDVFSHGEDDQANGHVAGNVTPLEPFTAKMDPTVAWMYSPGTLTVILVVFISAGIYGYHLDKFAISPRVKAHAGVLASIASFLVFCMLNFRDTLLRRPHPSFWRAVLGMNLLYFMVLVYLLFQSLDHARELVQALDPSLTVDVPEKSYAENCDFTPKNVWDGIDIFCLAHSLGWFGKAMILRDATLCWILSILFEICEYSLSHQLANFRECWWDHWLLDVALCNAGGIYVGMKTCEWLRVRPFSWQGHGQGRGLRGRSARMARSVLPHDWTAFEWKGTKKLRNYLATVSIISLFLMTELSVFYLKALLGLQPEHYLVVGRLAFMFLWAIPAVAETFHYLSGHKRVARLGSHAWLCLATVLLEVSLVLKWSTGLFPEPMPVRFKVFWVVFLTFVFVIYPTYKFYRPQLLREQKKRESAASAKAQ